MTLHALAVLRRRWFVILLCLGLGAAAAVWVTRSTPKTYRATDTLIVNIPRAGNAGEALQGVQLSTQLLASYAKVATTRAAALKVRESLGLPDSVGAIQGKISAAPIPETLLITISARDTDPIRAASLADAAAQVFIDTVASLEADKTDRVQPSVVDPAVVPLTPELPRPGLNLFLGLFSGALVAVALVLVLETLDRTVKGAAQLSELAERPLLGLIPRLPGATRLPIATLESPLTPGSEAFRALRTALRFLDPDNPLRTILITSPGPGDGKSTTASHFAVALAQSGERVILVDADLRRGSLFEQLGLPTGAGITSVVTRAAELDDVLYGWRDTFTVLGTGPLPPNPSEILGSQAMATIIEQLAARADVVVIDGAPVLPVTDSVALSTQVDAVLLVARDGKTDRHSVAEARRRLEGVGANLVGCVLNAAKATSGLYDDYQYLSVSARERSSLSSRLRRTGQGSSKVET